MKIYLASDHGGFKLKEVLKKYLQGKGYEIEDMGNTELDPNDDYPDFVFPLAVRVSKETDSFGIVLGRSGNGEAIAANKVKGIGAAVCLNEVMARKAREHNDANVLSLGADFIKREEAKKVVDVFLKTPFSEEKRYRRRVEKIASYVGEREKI